MKPKDLTHAQWLELVQKLLDRAPLNDVQRAMVVSLEDARTFTRSDKDFLSKLACKYPTVDLSIS